MKIKLENNEAAAFHLMYSDTNKHIIIPNVCISNPQNGKSINVMGFVDTGANRSCISSVIVDALGLSPSGKSDILTASGRIETDEFRVNLKFCDTPLSVDDVVVSNVDMNVTDEVIIGMDIITLGDFAISTIDGKVIASMVIPSALKMDLVMFSEVMLRHI